MGRGRRPHIFPIYIFLSFCYNMPNKEGRV